VATATDDEIAAFLEQNSRKDGGYTYDDIRDNLLFNFNNESDLHLFMRNMTQISCNVCLFGADYLIRSLQCPYNADPQLSVSL